MQRWARGVVVWAAWAATLPAWATLTTYLEPEELARRAPLALEASVLTSRSGFDPETGRLSTYVTLTVETVHRGPRDLEQVVLRELGGEFGEWTHVVDAVPRYEPGERVLVFLEPGRDGVLRTAGMSFGKFTIAEPERGSSTASRDVGGAGRFASRGGHPQEQFKLSDLIAVAESARPDRRRPESDEDRAGRRGGRDDTRERRDVQWKAVPPEFSRLLWDAPTRDGDGSSRDRAETESGDVLPFVLLSSSPARWYEIDSGGSLTFDVERARDPLGDPAAAVDAVRRALDAWTHVPESRLRLAVGNANASFTLANPRSPAAAYPSSNVVLFGDPYDDISDPSGCSGTLAIGGYWSSSTTGPAVNGQIFRRASRMYVIFNDGFECFLGTPDNLAEVATHEVGHAVGFGHSATADAVMRSSASGGRGARLGDDDRDAAHCVYPHALTMTSPNGGESWNAGTAHDVRWSSTAEVGPDPGNVDLDLSTDAGATWTPLASSQVNDGSWPWVVTGPSGSQYRVRVSRPNRLPGSTPAPFPSRCSSDRSDANFSLVSPARPGVVPDGPGIQVAKVDGSQIRLSWTTSCSADANAFAVYQGTLSALRLGIWDLNSRSCAAAGTREIALQAGPSSVYFLVAPLAGGFEGGLGSDRWGAPRPAAATPCAPADPLGASCP